jgi:hypothetical protein
MLSGAQEQRFILERKIAKQQGKTGYGKGETNSRWLECIGVLGA